MTTGASVFMLVVLCIVLPVAVMLAYRHGKRDGEIRERAKYWIKT